MATKIAATPAPDEGAFFMHLDDFLNTIHDEIRQATGKIHVESISAFGKLSKRAGTIKQTEAKWRSDFGTFMSSIPK